MTFNAKEVQQNLEAILASNHRQVAARCALLCAELVEAAREDERRLARERVAAAQSQVRDLTSSPTTTTPRYRDTGAWTKGFFGDSLARAAETRGYGQQPTLDRCHAERTNDRDCVWILRTAFDIRNKVISKRRLKESGEFSKEIEEDPPSTSSLKQPKTLLDPKLVERIRLFREMVQKAVGLWQERLLDDTPSLTRSATADCEGRPVEKDKPPPRHSWDGRTMRTENLGTQSLPAGQSPYRHLITPSPSGSGNHLEPPNGKPVERTGEPISPASATPKSRKEVQEDLGRELAQLAEDLRNAQIISSH